MKKLAVLLLVVSGLGAYFYWRKPAPLPQRLTPEGMVCLLHYASVTTSRGVTGFPPGTILRVIAKRSNTLVLGDGQVTVEVLRSDTTDDLDVAERLAHQEAVAQASIAAQNNAEAKAAADAERTALAKMEAERQQRAAANTSAPVGSSSSALNQPARHAGGVNSGPTYYYVPSSATPTAYYWDSTGRQYHYDSFGNKVYP
ncbi:MAG: hypothetical protein JO117_10910 [Verrucomicrobia bacterium]|nr:hypothetical protein [Verrucomicrobiota bacterium]MBV9659444.1 hypothetical protein [Verrucomicrobiota bacterium]